MTRPKEETPLGSSQERDDKEEACVGARPPAGGSSGAPTMPAGLVLGSVGRDLAFEAAMVERLGRLVCEGALIEVVDVHKEVCVRVCVCVSEESRDFTTYLWSVMPLFYHTCIRF